MHKYFKWLEYLKHLKLFKAKTNFNIQIFGHNKLLHIFKIFVVFYQYFSTISPKRILASAQFSRLINNNKLSSHQQLNQLGQHSFLSLFSSAPLSPSPSRPVPVLFPLQYRIGCCQDEIDFLHRSVPQSEQMWL